MSVVYDAVLGRYVVAPTSTDLIVARAETDAAIARAETRAAFARADAAAAAARADYHSRWAAYDAVRYPHYYPRYTSTYYDYLYGSPRRYYY